MKRTEDDILSRAPIKVKLGEVEYSIPVLSINPQRKWREQLSMELVPIVESFNSDVNNKAMLKGLAAALVNFPEKLGDLVFAYAGTSLDREKILEEATEEQLATAFSNIMVVAFPFLAQLGLVTQLVRATTV